MNVVVPFVALQPVVKSAHMLGCAKLGEGLMRELPGIWDAPGHWSELDQRLFFAARDAGIEPHLHRPPVIHLNPRDLR
jgi:hypothetical protein